MTGVVVLLSGGVDSAVLLARAVEAGTLRGVVWCNYGQPACLAEWRAMMALVKHLAPRTPIHEVPLTTLSARAMQAPMGEEGPRVVPFRNLVMLAHALNYADSIGAAFVWYGANRDDWADYPDCRPAFVHGLNNANEAAENGTVPNIGVRVEAPLSWTSKAAVLAEADRRGLLPLAWSCYSPRHEKPCGTCNACRLRASAA